MSAEDCVLDVRLVRQIHAALTIDVGLCLGPEIGVLFGPSGSGKTSILRLITGLARPDAGHVRVAGAILFDASRAIHRPLRLRRIGLIFQDDLLFPHLNVADNIKFGLVGMTREDCSARLVEVANLCGVAHLMDRFPATLSGGERQRVGLARAMAPRPRILLCDEPVSALDLPNRQILLERLRAIQNAEGTPVLYVTHSSGEAITLGSRLFLLENGRIVAEGRPLDVLAANRGSSSNYLDEIRNTLPARVESHLPGNAATLLRLDNGPSLTVGFQDKEPGSGVTVSVRSEDIILALGPISGVSAQNVISGQVERVLLHGQHAEVVVRTAGVTWIASLVVRAVEQLSLASGQSVHIIIKARSCHVLPGDPGPLAR
jgi:molybdate transport system ATP-binding protein